LRQGVSEDLRGFTTRSAAEIPYEQPRLLAAAILWILIEPMDLSLARPRKILLARCSQQTMQLTSAIHVEAVSKYRTGKPGAYTEAILRFGSPLRYLSVLLDVSGELPRR
jgi:hypothetical protein